MLKYVFITLVSAMAVTGCSQCSQKDAEQPAATEQAPATTEQAPADAGTPPADAAAPAPGTEAPAAEQAPAAGGQ